MELSNFAVGKKYEAKKLDFTPPDGFATVPGGAIRFTVLEPVNEVNHKCISGETPAPTQVSGWAAFLRVQNHDKERVHLLHPSTLETAVELA